MCPKKAMVKVHSAESEAQSAVEGRNASIIFIKKFLIFMKLENRITFLKIIYITL